MTNNYDCCHKNYYLYRDSGNTNEWQIHPWDVDLSFGHNWKSGPSYFDDLMDYNNSLKIGANNSLLTKLYTAATTPGFEEMYYRRLRTLMDEYYKPPGTPYEELYFERRLDEFVALIDPHDDPFDPTPRPAAWPSAGTEQSRAPMMRTWTTTSGDRGVKPTAAVLMWPAARQCANICSVSRTSTWRGGASISTH